MTAKYLPIWIGLMLLALPSSGQFMNKSYKKWSITPASTIRKQSEFYESLKKSKLIVYKFRPAGSEESRLIDEVLRSWTICPYEVRDYSAAPWLEESVRYLYSLIGYRKDSLYTILHDPQYSVMMLSEIRSDIDFSSPGSSITQPACQLVIRTGVDKKIVASGKTLDFNTFAAPADEFHINLPYRGDSSHLDMLPGQEAALARDLYYRLNLIAKGIPDTLYRAKADIWYSYYYGDVRDRLLTKKIVTVEGTTKPEVAKMLRKAVGTIGPIEIHEMSEENIRNAVDGHDPQYLVCYPARGWSGKASRKWGYNYLHFYDCAAGRMVIHSPVLKLTKKDL